MKFLVRFVQIHETFRVAELESLAVSHDIQLEIVEYITESPFCIVELASEDAARRLVRNSILIKSIHELWGRGLTYPQLHEDVQTQSRHLWPQYQTGSFKFTIDGYQGSRDREAQRRLVESCSYLGFKGPIRMKNPDQSFTIHEYWLFEPTYQRPEPEMVYLTRDVGMSDRDAIVKYDLKKRKYISTTSMDSELALVTANIALAGPGKLFYDPFVGTGSFPIACSHYGALTWGSDIDGRSIRGKGKIGLVSNFEQYGLKSAFGDCFAADLTNTPIRATRFLDGIVCDPPYGVREGLKVLGNRNPDIKGKLHVNHDGVPSHLLPDFIAPKKPYSFLAMLDDILDFAAMSLVDNGRLSMWVPTSNEASEEVKTPTHPCLELVSVCTQNFNKCTFHPTRDQHVISNCEAGSRKLITYRRLQSHEEPGLTAREKIVVASGNTANDLNNFRKRYFESFKPGEQVLNGI